MYTATQQLRDLLDHSNEGGGGRSSNGSSSSSGSSSSTAAKLSIKRSTDGSMEVAGLTRRAIDANDGATGLQQLEALMGKCTGLKLPTSHTVARSNSHYACIKLVHKPWHATREVALNMNKSGSGLAGWSKLRSVQSNQGALLVASEAACVTPAKSTAQRARSVARTDMNDQSSRSHSVFTLWLKGVNQASNTTLQGVLHMVDLAGSERLDRSGAANDKKLLKETQAINKSLSCLADVFTALGNKASHIPFRNSKLTYLLQDCLSGDGKALMMVNCSPTAASHTDDISIQEDCAVAVATAAVAIASPLCATCSEALAKHRLCYCCRCKLQKAEPANKRRKANANSIVILAEVVQ
eukprot:1393-Heterococcus_DN1.PRE.4